MTGLAHLNTGQNQEMICIVTSGHVSYCPRALKEADALSVEGYNVRVVALNQEPDKWAFDQSLIASRKWRLDAYDAGKTSAWFVSGVRQRICRKISRANLSGVLERACSRYFSELTRLAATERADLYIAHTLPALPVAAAAARMHHAKFGFDAEDFHRGELTTTSEDEQDRKLIEAIEEKYISRCDFVTAASDGIGEAYSTALGIKKPITILNVFPLAERSGHTPPAELAAERKGDGLSLYWYSQVIGPGRGLEDAFEAVALLRPQAHLHLRGAMPSDYRPWFDGQIGRLKIADYVHALPPCPPEQLIERAAQHDVGLALEPGDRPNNRIAASNKLFAYFLAGIAVAATDVPGQLDILKQAEGSGFTYPAGDSKFLAQHLQQWVDHLEELKEAKRHSRSFGETKFCWEIEKQKFISVVAKALG